MIKKSEISNAVDSYVNKAMIQVSKDLHSSIVSANNKLHKEAIDMFNCYIRKFYEYETTSYIRDYEGMPGTREGSYLYNAKNGSIAKKNGKNPMLYINPEKFGQVMPDRKRDYEYDTPYKVSQLVSNGIRFYHNGILYTWSYMYKGKYFSFIGGSMRDAFDDFNKNFNTIAENIIKDEMKNKGYDLG